MSALDLALALDTARRAVAAAAAASLRHFRTDLVIDVKADRSPVTAADREADAAIVAVLRAAFPAHAILTEESGALEGASESRWIVDPLDGTRGFSRGGSFWGPLVALEHEGEVVAGAMALPALGTTYYAARGMGAFRDGTRLQVSSVGDLADATLQLGEVGALLGPPHGPAIVALTRALASTRSFGDLAGIAALLDGRADVWLECGVKTWDVAPHAILIAEAGGRFSDFSGRVSIDGSSAVGTNGILHDRILAALRPA